MVRRPPVAPSPQQFHISPLAPILWSSEGGLGLSSTCDGLFDSAGMLLAAIISSCRRPSELQTVTDSVETLTQLKSTSVSQTLRRLYCLLNSPPPLPLYFHHFTSSPRLPLTVCASPPCVRYNKGSSVLRLAGGERAEGWRHFLSLWSHAS